MRYALAILLVLIGLSSAQSTFSGGTTKPGPSVSTSPSVPVITSPVQQDIYLTSRTEYILSDQNKAGVAVILSAWQPGTPTDTLVPNVDIYITGNTSTGSTFTKRMVNTGTSGNVIVEWFFGDKNDKSWILNFSQDPNDPYAPGSAFTTVSSYIPEDKNPSFTNKETIEGAYDFQPVTIHP